LKNKDFNSAREIILNIFPKDNYILIQVLLIAEKIYNFVPMLKKPIMKNSDILSIIHKMRNEYKNFNFILQNFSELENLLQKIIDILIDDDKEKSIKEIENLINSELSYEILFDFLNKNLLEINYNVSSNEIDLIIKHSCLLFSEGLKENISDIHFILRNQDFIDDVNYNLYQNSFKFNDEKDLPNVIKFPPQEKLEKKLNN
jgi:hypothetical protein